MESTAATREKRDIRRGYATGLKDNLLTAYDWNRVPWHERLVIKHFLVLWVQPLDRATRTTYDSNLQTVNLQAMEI